MYRIALIAMLAITLTGMVGCEPADSGSAKKSATRASARPQPEPVSWELEPIDKLPDEMKGIWKADVTTVRRVLRPSMNYGDAMEYANGVLLDVYPYNLHFTGLMGDEESVTISKWYVTPNDVYVGKGKTEDRWNRSREITVYMRIKAKRLEVAFLDGETRPDWKETYSLVRE